MDDLRPLRALARALGVHTRYTDGLGRHVTVAPETLVRVCAALGAPVTRPGDAPEALRAHRATANRGDLPPVLVAWEGTVPRLPVGRGALHGHVQLENGEVRPLDQEPLPLGYHRLTVETSSRTQECTIIAAPLQAWRRPGSHRSWGVGAHLAALRSSRSRSMADLEDLESLCRWVHGRGGDLVTVLPIHPTFNADPPEPSPYSPVSRLFWSELMLDLENAHRPASVPNTLDVMRADAEVRAALASRRVPEADRTDEELTRYARFRGAQVRLGRNWRAWPAAARGGALSTDQVEPDEERFHLVAQTMVRQQIHELHERLDRDGMRLGLDLAVGVHPDGYDPWSRQSLFADGMSVGAPPDAGFPSGQDWGFSPVMPQASRREGHRYLAASIDFLAGLAGVLRVDHIMAWTRLYWIPQGFGLDQGTYVSYPAEELFAILTLASNRHRSEIVGENLGTVPREIDEALPRHRIWGMYLAQFQASCADVTPPGVSDVAYVGTHDTPPFAGWLTGTDVEDRVRHRLLPESAAPQVRAERAAAAQRLADEIGVPLDDPRTFLDELLAWLGRSHSPLVIPWLEDLWLEDVGVNLPGTRSSDRPNWQRPMRRLLDEIITDRGIDALIRRLDSARSAEADHAPPPAH
jgi:4-alpha-glucanotransferase